MKVEVGQQVFVVFGGSSRRERREHLTVRKVGRKWAYTDRYRFNIETGYIDGNGRVYLSEAEYEHGLRIDLLWREIEWVVRNQWRRPEHLSLADLETIKSMLSPDRDLPPSESMDARE